MKKTILIKLGATIATGATTSVVVLPFVINGNSSKIGKLSNIKLFNRNFSGREQLIKYALENSNLVSNKEGKVYFSAQNSGEKLFLSNFELRKYISNNIEQLSVKNLTDIKQKYLNSDNSILVNKLNEMLILTKSKTQRYFRGTHNTIFENRLNAIKSYFQYHKVFYYDNITFRNLEELKRYLYKNYSKLKVFNSSKKQNIISPSGLVSNFLDFNSETDREEARRFISNTATSLIGFEKKDGSYDYVDVNDILKNSLNNSFWQGLDINQINAVHITPNDGNALWITDSNKTDRANLYGNYFTRSKSNEIKQITNSEHWKKTSENINYKSIKKIKNAKKIGNFFSMLNKLSAYKDIDLSDTKENNEKLSKINKVEHILDVPKYKKQLESHPSLSLALSRLRTTSDTIARGKRYNPLYELPLLYTQTLSNIQNWNLKNRDLNILRNIFQEIADDYQNTLETLFPKESLVTKEGKAFNVAKLFGINDSSYDINSNPESQLYALTESSKFMEAINIFMEALENKVMNGGAKQFFMTKFSENNNKNSYFSRLWNVLSSRSNNITTTSKTPKDSIRLALGKKTLNDVQTKFISNLLKINDKLEDSNNKLIQKASEHSINKIKGLFSEGKNIDLNKIPTSINDQNIEEIRDILKFKFNKTFFPTIKEFEKNAETIDSKDRFNIKFLRQIQKKSFKKEELDMIKRSLKSSWEQKISYTIVDKIHGGIEILKNLQNAMIDAAKLTQAIQRRDVYSSMKSLNSLFGTAAKLTAGIPFAGVTLEALALITDVTSEIIGKKIQEVYKFKTTEENAKPFYWDGGESTVRFWGLWTKQDYGKDSMKIIEPQKIINGFKKDVWLYNGQVYSDIIKLKKQALLDYSNGDKDALILGENNNSLKRGFTFEKMSSDNQLKKGALVTKSKAELANAFVPKTKLKTINNLLNQKIKSTEFTLIGGKVAQIRKNNVLTQELIKENINALLDKIKPTLVVQMPKTDHNIPIDQISETTKANNIYEIPGKLYYKNGVIYKSQNNTNEYLELNLNQLKMKQTNSQTPKFMYPSTSSAIKVLEENFIKNITVKSILSIQNNFLHTRKFTDLFTPKELNLYKARGKSGNVKYFKTYLDAYKWLSSSNVFNVKTIIQKDDNKSISFDGHIFKNTNELIKYLDELLGKVGK